MTIFFWLSLGIVTFLFSQLKSMVCFTLLLMIETEFSHLSTSASIREVTEQIP